MRFKQYLIESASLTTSLQESLHCVGFGIAQTKNSLTKELLLDGDLFTKSYDTLCDVDVNVDMLYTFAVENESWVDSVVNNVNSIRKSGYIKKNGYRFYRSNGVMKSVYQRSKQLLKKSGIKLNPDKWNPGDIWISTFSNIPEFDNIVDFNKWISQQLKKKTLIGISLKKSKGEPKIVYIDQGSDKESLKFKSVRKPKNVFITGISILTDNPKISLNVRSFMISNASAVTSELIIKGSSARHGKKALTGYVKKYMIPWSDMAYFKNNSDNIQEMIGIIISLYNECGITFSRSKIESDWDIRSKEKQYNRNPVGYFRSIINSLQFGAYMSRNKGVSDDIMTDIYLSGSSMGEYSSDFIKVY